MTIKARYDGHVFVPDGPVAMTAGNWVEIPIPEPKPEPPSATPFKDEGPPRFLADLLRIAEEFPDDPNTPPDLAEQHDHYLYGTPKRP